MKEVGEHRGRAVQMQIMLLGNDPEREGAFIPSHVKRGGSA